MEVHKNIRSFRSVNGLVLTPGTFDGVHKGHLTILQKVKELAREKKSESAVLTFYPHPRTILFPDADNLKQLNTLTEKIERLEAAGIDHLIVFPFTVEFSRLSAVEYVRELLVNKLDVDYLVVGYDHHFGRHREGNMAVLKESAGLYEFEVIEIPAKEIDDVKISSTKIRQALLSGDLETAKKYLGYDYCISGIVIKGKAVGRTLGFPTANINVPNENKLIPANGIYAVEVEHHGRKYNGMLSIGSNPTVNNNREQVHIEVNIFHFKANIYGDLLKLTLHKKIREEEKFENTAALKSQMELDKIEVQKLFSREK